MTVTVYTTPNCMQCDQTKKVLKRQGISFDSVDLSENKDALDYVLSLGYSAAPVVVAGKEHWSGFRMSRLMELVTSNRESVQA